MYKAVEEAVELGAKSFAMFLKSQRQWNSKPLEDKVAERFRESCKVSQFGSYLMTIFISVSGVARGGGQGGGICPRAPPGGGRQNPANNFF